MRASLGLCVLMAVWFYCSFEDEIITFFNTDTGIAIKNHTFNLGRLVLVGLVLIMAYNYTQNKNSKRK